MGYSLLAPEAVIHMYTREFEKDIMSGIVLDLLIIKLKHRVSMKGVGVQVEISTHRRSALSTSWKAWVRERLWLEVTLQRRLNSEDPRLPLELDPASGQTSPCAVALPSAMFKFHKTIFASVLGFKCFHRQAAEIRVILLLTREVKLQRSSSC